MCCSRRSNRNTLTMAKLAQNLLATATASRTAEPLGPPPAYEHIEKDARDINNDTSVQATEVIDTRMLSKMQAAPEHATIYTDVDSSSNLAVPTAKSTCQSRCAAKRERKREQKQIKREYREEKRELRAEYRDERRNMQRDRSGPIGMLIKGVSSLMKQ
ncbi:hypothetical protein E4T47_03137 [Aureobasidium subglaciale]|nr:hypothetical protein E4T47_03137 [Aureobasidium subglaciale]